MHSKHTRQYPSPSMKSELIPLFPEVMPETSVYFPLNTKKQFFISHTLTFITISSINKAFQ